MMDVILGYPSSPEAFAIAKRIGFDGIQVTLGKSIGPNRLVLSDGELQQRILRSSRAHHVAITSTYLDIVHRDCLQSSDIAKTWVRESIAITKALDASMVELASFFKCGLNTPSDIDGLVKALRELAPQTERERVMLGIENTLSAEDNARILDRVGSPMVKIWYDVGNSTNMGHFDVPSEIRFLGKERICQIHMKDAGYLGSGRVDVKACLEAIRDIEYTGWCVFETAAPTGDKVADAEKNLKIFREIESSLAVRRR
jgi:sugar phosphate isomerase/epimerase